MHAQATSREDDIKHLKEKCDAGAEIIITQLFYNNEIFIDWVKDCRAAGITAHFIPGLMPILGYERFARTIKFCKTNVPPQISADLETMKNDDEKVRQYGVESGIKMCQELINNGFKFLHFYTMNLEASVVKIIKGLGILKSKKQLPFAARESPMRQGEEVRPIFWANKPMSYIAKTQQWDEFPNGRWGDVASPAFSQGFDDDDEKDVSGFMSYSKKFKAVNIQEKRKAWGHTCTSLKDISNVFCNYINGKIKKFPFAEGGLAEANRLSAELAAAETENTKLSERNEALAREVIALQAGTEAVEKNARENLGLIKEGEVYYQFVEEPDTP